MNIERDGPKLSEVVLESAPDSIFIFRAGDILYANRATALLFGYREPREILAVPLDALFDHESLELIRERERRMNAPGERCFPREYRAQRKDGAWVIVDVTLFVISHEGAPASVAFARDVSERHRMREQLARADRMAALGMLAAGVAHEINNPLAYMALGIEALGKHLTRMSGDSHARDAALALLEPIRIGADRVTDIVRELRTLSRPEADLASPVPLSSVIVTAQQMVAHELRDRTRVSVRIEGDPRVIGHAGRLEQVLINLLTNAAQAFTNESVDPQIIITCAERSGNVELDIEDNGPGIPPNLRARVFDPFFTTKPAGVGTGLGLSICHGIVNRMGGEITIDARSCGGTRVRVRLPSTPVGETRQSEERDAGISTRERRLRVLVVDDEPALGRAVQSLLSREHEVAMTTNGAEGFERIASVDPPDVVLCDLMMPEMTGAELHARVLREYPALARRFVFMTGGAITSETRAFLTTIAQPCLQKPFSPSELREVLLRVGSSQ